MQVIRRFVPWALILAAPAAMLYPLWSNPLSAGEDDVLFNYPLRKMVAQAFGEGRWPVYNPREATGMPLMGDPQAATMYPLSVLLARMDAKQAYGITIFSAFMIAGAGAYLYLRGLGLVPAAATFGALAFMFSGFMVGHRVHLARLQTAAFLPWGLWCIELLRRKPRAAFLCLAPVAALSVTAGDWAILTYMVLLWGAYSLFRARPVARSLAIVAAAWLLALALAAPQLQATVDLLAQATRKGIGYAEFSENSFFPPAAVLAVFPMLLGSRTPNFFPQTWWGPWHLCEMLGYVGLATLALAGASVWRLYRKGRPNDATQPPDGSEGALADADVVMADPRRIVRLWTWIAIAAGIWMLGYYLPTYRLVHLVPVLNVVRCPARMVVAVDMALASLAAIAIHVVSCRQAPQSADGLRKTVRRAASIVLPLVMLGALGAMYVAARLLAKYSPQSIPSFTGKPADALAAVRLANPAVWVPLALAVATGVVIRYWLARADRRSWLLVGMLLADLFFIARFVDVPAGNAVRVDPEASPAAEWLRAYAPKDEPLVVYGLARGLTDRPAELLLPKTGQSLGFATLGGYGAWHSAAHAQLLGFDHYGGSRRWRELLGRNYLLSLLNVRYVLAADKEFREAIESVRIPQSPPTADGPNILAGDWKLQNADWSGGVLRLGTPLGWSVSFASQVVRLAPAEVYRIRLDARSPDGRMGNLLRVQVCTYWKGYADLDDACLQLNTEEVGKDWRHFEWTFRGRPEFKDNATFVISTTSEQTVEIRNVSLGVSQWDQPLDLQGTLHPGEPVYQAVARLPALKRGEPDVFIYENRLCLPPSKVHRVPASAEQIERLREGRISRQGEVFLVPDVAISARIDPAGMLRDWSLPACVLYLSAAVVLAWGHYRRNSGGRRKTSRQVPA